MVISVSYECDDELLAVTERLHDLPLRVSKKTYIAGRYKRVYLKSVDETDEKRGKASDRPQRQPNIN